MTTTTTTTTTTTQTYNYFIHLGGLPQFIPPDNIDKLFAHITTLTGISRDMAELILHGGNPIISGNVRVTAAKAHP